MAPSLPALTALLAYSMLACASASGVTFTADLQISGRLHGSLNGGGGGGGGRELHSWLLTTSWVMSQVQNVTWSLGWQDLMGSEAPRSNPGMEQAQQAAAHPEAKLREQQQKLMVQCVNDKWRPGAEMNWDAALAGAQSALKVVGAWWSNQAPSQPITVVTSASVSRLSQLYAQCLSWPGPLSAVLYIALPADTPGQPSGVLSQNNQAILRMAVLQVAQFLLDMQEEAEACQPDIILTYELYNDDSARQLLYPCNVPRNLARLQARTPLVALLDVDLVVSRSLYTRASDPQQAAKLIKAINEKTAFIIPAFDVRGQHERAAWADALVSGTGTKDLLRYAYKRDVVFQFGSVAYPIAHNMTNYTRWMYAGHDYNVPFQAMSEPWILGDRLKLPWHDSRYRGYGLNKQQFIAHVNASGFKWRVLHDVFTIHRAHKINKAKDIFRLGINSKGPEPRLFAYNAGLFKRQIALHAANNGTKFDPPLNPATVHCRAALPWWTDPAAFQHRHRFRERHAAEQQQKS